MSKDVITDNITGDLQRLKKNVELPHNVDKKRKFSKVIW